MFKITNDFVEFVASIKFQTAKENLRVSNDTYAAGKELLTDKLIAQTQWEKANSELIEAKTAY